MSMTHNSMPGTTPNVGPTSWGYILQHMKGGTIVPTPMAILLPFMLLLTQLLFHPISSLPTNTITQLQNLTDGNTLVSNNEIYELGFFSPGISSNHYLGIWYHKIPVKTYVWVANRDNPIKDKSSMLSITSEGKLVLLSQNKTIVWSANSTNKPSNPIVQLLDSGNLILRGQESEDPQSYSWQSFDYPSDTLLAGMKLGWDSKTGLDRRLTSWKNWDDPSTGDFTTGILRNNYPELVIWKGDTEYSRTGPWNGNNFVGIPVQQRLNELFEFEFVFNKDEVYYKYELKNKSMISRWVLNETQGEGTRLRMRWIEKEQIWKFYTSVPTDFCEKSYNNCGPYGYCVVGESPICQCLDRFKMKSQEDADNMNWTQGCVRNETWSCGEKNKDGFVPFSGLLLPDAKKTWVNASMTLDDCKSKCLENCSCTAYANSNINGSGCVIWFGDLTDLKNISSPVQNLYIRMAVTVPEEAKHWKTKTIVVAVTVPLVLLILFTFSYLCITRRKLRETEDETKQEDMEDLPFFDFATIANATNGFTNKLGEGGFGPVYRGRLVDEQEIAVKRLSKNSIQGIKEFKNEVILCSKLQHRNLVKIIGCCTRGEEKMLVYEYMSNRSLDYFLFDSTKSKLLDWSKRFDILCGIARGLLYLHQDSRLRIIHRDLKTSNILLDNNLNPKISDFGLAKMFGGDQVEGNTSKVVGTHGYMAPEYAIDGEFSTKTDVFTFGIILLEIVSGRKNRVVYSSNQKLNLISHAWRLWKEGNVFELIDGCLRDSVILSEVLRCIHIGLLCLQHHPEDRPSMATVVLMLSSSTAILSEPKESGFLLEKVSSSSIEGESSSSMRMFSSFNEMSVTEVSSR